MGHAISGQWDARELEKKQKELYSSDVSLEPVIFKEQKSMYHSEASPRIIHPQDEKRGEKRLIASDEIFGEKGIVYPVGHIPKDDEKIGFFDRWREYRKMVREEYPFVRGKELKNVWRLPLYYLGYMVSDHISENWFPEANRDTIIKNIAGGYSDAMRIRYQQGFSMGVYNTFPRIRVLSAFSDDATVIEKVYTTEVIHDGVTYEIPVFLQKHREEKPDDALLIRNVNFTKNHKISLYNKIEGIAKKFLEKYFDQFGIEKFSRGDFKRYFHYEPERFYRWLGKDSGYHIAQYGEKDTVAEAALPPALTGQVKVYKSPTKESGFWYRLGNLMGDESPSSWKTFWYWQIGDWIYDGVDLLFGPAEAMLRKAKIPTTAIRRIVDSEYKVAAGTRRNFFPGRKINFTYESPKLTDNAIRRAAEEARGFGYV